VYTLFDVFDAARDLYETLAIKELRGYEGNLRTKGYSSSKRVEYVKYENLGHEEKILMDKAAVKRQFDLGYLKFGTEFATGDSKQPSHHYLLGLLRHYPEASRPA